MLRLETQVHYGNQLHSLSGEARNLRATIQPDDQMLPRRVDEHRNVRFSELACYDGRPINNIDIGRGAASIKYARRSGN